MALTHLCHLASGRRENVGLKMFQNRFCGSYPIAGSIVGSLCTWLVAAAMTSNMLGIASRSPLHVVDVFHLEPSRSITALSSEQRAKFVPTRLERKHARASG